MAKKAKKAKTGRTAKPAKTKTAARRVSPTRKTATSTSGSALVSLSAGFTVSDAEKSVAWYRDVLGFTVKERWEHEGQFRGAQMTSGGATLNLGQDDWKMGRDRIKGQGTRLYITTRPKIDRLADQIKARGGSLDHEPRNEWGMRAFSIKDPDGFNLTFMTMLKK